MKSKSKLLGFSVAEAILALLITVICIELLIGILGCLKSAHENKEPINEIAFSYVQLENFLKEEGHVEVNMAASNSGNVILKKKIGEKDGQPLFHSYSLEQYKDMIRMTGINGGHMPLLMNIKTASFVYGEDYFEIKVVEKDNRKSNLRFKTDKSIKIQKNINRKVIKNKEKEIKDEKN